MGCNKCARCCQEFSYELNGDELWVKKLVKFLEVMRLRNLLKIVKEVKIIMRCKYLDENNRCEIYEKRPKRCRDFLCKKAKEVEMFAKYLCLGCGITWRSNRLLVICPVCGSKAVKVKDGVDTKGVKDKLKGGKKIDKVRIQKTNLGTVKRF